MLVTAVADNAPNPVSVPYTSGGGTLLVQFSGSAWSQNASQMLSANLNMDGTQVATASVFANNASTHMALVPVAVRLNGVNPGAHTFTVSAGPGTTIDSNDLFTITVYEYFLS